MSGFEWPMPEVKLDKRIAAGGCDEPLRSIAHRNAFRLSRLSLRARPSAMTDWHMTR